MSKALQYVKKQIKDLEEIQAKEGSRSDRQPLNEVIGTLQRVETLIEQDELERVRLHQIEKEIDDGRH